MGSAMSSSSSASSSPQRLLSVHHQLHSLVSDIYSSTSGSTDSSYFGSATVVQSVCVLISFLVEKHIARPDLIVKFGFAMLSNDSARTHLGNQLWDYYERVCIAGTACQNDSVVAFCINALHNRFGASSVRLERLAVLRFESQKKIHDAKSVLEDRLKLEPTVLWALKRRVCCALSSSVSSGSGSAAAAEEDGDGLKCLLDYVTVYSNDDSAWLFLGQLYLSNCFYEPARFCFEECISLAPENHFYHLLLAETLYTLQAYDLARAYFAQALELNSQNNLRAIYGLILSIKAGGVGVNGKAFEEWTVKHWKKTLNSSNAKNAEKLIQIAENALNLKSLAKADAKKISSSNTQNLPLASASASASSSPFNYTATPTPEDNGKSSFSAVAAAAAATVNPEDKDTIHADTLD